MLTEIDMISSQSSFLDAKPNQAQLGQPILIRELFPSPIIFAVLQELHVLKSPELDGVLQMQPHQGGVMHLLFPGWNVVHDDSPYT